MHGLCPNKYLSLQAIVENLSNEVTAMDAGNLLLLVLICLSMTLILSGYPTSTELLVRPQQMLYPNNGQLPLLLFVVSANHICSCYAGAQQWGLQFRGAWRIIMARLTRRVLAMTLVQD